MRKISYVPILPVPGGVRIIHSGALGLPGQAAVFRRGAGYPPHGAKRPPADFGTANHTNEGTDRDPPYRLRAGLILRRRWCQVRRQPAGAILKIPPKIYCRETAEHPMEHSICPAPSPPWLRLGFSRALRQLPPQRPNAPSSWLRLACRLSDPSRV